MIWYWRLNRILDKKSASKFFKSRLFLFVEVYQNMKVRPVQCNDSNNLSLTNGIYVSLCKTVDLFIYNSGCGRWKTLRGINEGRCTTRPTPLLSMYLIEAYRYTIYYLNQAISKCVVLLKQDTSSESTHLQAGKAKQKSLQNRGVWPHHQRKINGHFVLWS